MPSPGQPAPDADLLDTEGRPYRLSTAWDQGPALLVFYPGDDTAVCTRQLCEYRDHWNDFTRRGVAVVGINPAGVERHRGFRARHAFPFPLLADRDGVCCRAYGASAWYGTRRLAVIVSRDGRVRAEIATLPFLKPRLERLLAAIDQG